MVFINLYIFYNIELKVNSHIFQLILNIPVTNKFSLHLMFNYILFKDFFFICTQEVANVENMICLALHLFEKENPTM